METVNQPSAIPTNKLTAATVAAPFVSFSGLVVRNLWPTCYGAELWAAMMPLAVFAAGWLIRDRRNVPIEERAE